MKIHTYKGFTLVELIVVITILAVLATIWFVSFQWYWVSARDSVRIADIRQIEKSLSLHEVKHGSYPIPSNAINVTHSWQIAWYQWWYWKSVLALAGGMSKVPTDPLTWNEYAYSVVYNQKEMQLAAVMEWPVASGFSQTYAATSSIAWNAYVTWNYNWKFIKLSTADTITILWVPSIITNEITDVDIQSILDNRNFVYKWYQNIPATYIDTWYTMGWGFNFMPSSWDPVLFEWTAEDLNSWLGKIDFATKLKAYYDSSVLQGNQNYENIVSLDIAQEPGGAIELINTYLTNNIWGLNWDISTSYNATSAYLIDFETENWYTPWYGNWIRSTDDPHAWEYSYSGSWWTFLFEDAYVGCFNINKDIAYPFSINLYANGQTEGFDPIWLFIWEWDFLTEWESYQPIGFVWWFWWWGWKSIQSQMFAAWNYSMNICYISNSPTESIQFDDISFNLRVNWVCSNAIDKSFSDISDLYGIECNTWTPSTIIDHGIWTKFSWTCEGSLWGTSETCSAIHATIPDDIINFESTWWYNVTSGNWIRSTNQAIEWSYALESWPSSCFEIEKNFDSNFELIYYTRDSNNNMDTRRINFYVNWNSPEFGAGNRTTVTNLPDWNQYSYLYDAWNYTFRWCSSSYGTNPAYIDNISFNTGWVCDSYDANSSVLPAKLCRLWNAENIVDNWEWSTFTWDCVWNTTNSCYANHAPSTSTYPWCDTPDIIIWNTTISACNIGTSTAWTWSTSYWSYFYKDDIWFEWDDDICASWYRVSTQSDWNNIIEELWIEAHEYSNPWVWDIVSNTLLMPYAWWLSSWGELWSDWVEWCYWSNHQNAAEYLSFTESRFEVDTYGKWNFHGWYSIRCVKWDKVSHNPTPEGWFEEWGEGWREELWPPMFGF